MLFFIEKIWPTITLLYFPVECRVQRKSIKLLLSIASCPVFSVLESISPEKKKLCARVVVDGWLIKLFVVLPFFASSCFVDADEDDDGSTDTVASIWQSLQKPQQIPTLLISPPRNPTGPFLPFSCGMYYCLETRWETRRSKIHNSCLFPFARAFLSHVSHFWHQMSHFIFSKIL